MPKVSNIKYREFLDNGNISLLTTEDYLKALEKAGSCRHPLQTKAFITVLYYTACRPCEALQLKGSSGRKAQGYLNIQIPGAKKGLPRNLPLKTTLPGIPELHAYMSSVFPDMLLFPDLRSNYIRTFTRKDGTPYQLTITSAKVYYLLKKCFGEMITPYFMRHSRLSQLSSDGAQMEQLMMWKGGKSVQCVRPYLHLSSDVSKQLARKIKG